MAAPTAVRFDADGEQPWVQLGASLESGFTIAGWVYMSVDCGDYTTLFDVDDGTTTEWVLLQSDSGGDAMRADVSDAVNGSATALTISTWYFVALWFSGTQAGWYYAALADPTLTAGGSTATTGGETGIDYVRLGESIYGGEWFNGRIQGVKLWDVVLTEPQLEDERTQLDPVKTSDIVSSWRLASQTDTTDYSGSNTLSAMTGATTEAGSGIENTSGTVETVIRPIADTAATGWDSAPTGSQSLWSQVDEAVTSDTDYIYTTDPNP